MTKHKVSVSLQGIRKFAWRKNLSGFFSISGRSLTNSEVLLDKYIVNIAIKSWISNVNNNQDCND